ncbi:MAG: tRNA (adenosine(37)-N6)-threonylcarbamoyltransferase complex dimerization subunit type 1 TsaB [Planctomycetaceae bacterium]
MLLLAVETSTHTGSLCLAKDRHVIAVRTLQTEGRRHAQSLVQEVALLLSENGFTPADLRAVAVSAGPGSFTGLRVGVVFAKTLASAAEIPLLAVDTLQAIACQLSPDDALESQPPRLLVISDAQRNEVFASDYQWDREYAIWQRSGQIRIAALADLPPTPVVAGPAVAKHREELIASRRFLRCQEVQPHAREVAMVASHQLSRGQLADVSQLEPVYVRPSYAEEKRMAVSRHPASGEFQK